MKFLSIISLLFLWALLMPALYAQTVDISSGGLPTVTGSGSVNITASSSTTQNLNVSINLGDISPLNNSNTIKIIVPVAIRSIVPYQVSVNSSGTFNPNLRAFQASDIGFGLQNMRSSGAGASQCTQSTHDFRSPFANNPETAVTFNSKGRAVYTSSVDDAGISSVILSGPRLSLDSGATVSRSPDNAYIFDAVFVVKPQFYAPGSFSLNLTFAIAEGAAAPC